MDQNCSHENDIFSATHYQPIMTEAEILEAENDLEKGLTAYDEEYLYIKTRHLQRQKKYLENSFQEKLQTFFWLKNVIILIQLNFE